MSPEATTKHPPPLGLPLVYLGTGHLCLLLALVATIAWPDIVTLSFLAPRTLVVVHLVTIGFITLGILGATYVVAPLAFRTRLPDRGVHRWACVMILLGGSGVVSHFWLDGFSSVASAGAAFVVGVVLLAGRILRAMAPQVPGPILLHLCLAWVNLVLAGVLGGVVAFDHDHLFLRDHLSSIFAHAHLAVLGWATMMFMGIGYRLLPMFLPAAPPRGLLPWLSAVLVEAGLLALVACMLFARPDWLAWIPWCASVSGLGLLVFFANVFRMLRQRRPPPKKLPRPDPAMLLAKVAIVYLLVSLGLGLYLVWSGQVGSGWRAMYGTCALVGFLCQAILAFSMRLLPLLVWTEAWVGGGFQEIPASPHDMPSPRLQWLVVASWLSGVPVLLLGLGIVEPRVTAAGAWLLLVGTVAAVSNSLRVLGYVRRKNRPAVP